MFSLNNCRDFKGSNIRLKVLFLNSLKLPFLLNVSDHFLQPYSTTGNIPLLYILILKLLERSRKDESVWTIII